MLIMKFLDARYLAFTYGYSIYREAWEEGCYAYPMEVGGRSPWLCAPSINNGITGQWCGPYEDEDKEVELSILPGLFKDVCELVDSYVSYLNKFNKHEHKL